MTNTLQNGTTTTGCISTAKVLTIDSTSTWNATSNSVVTCLTNSGTINLTGKITTTNVLVKSGGTTPYTWSIVWGALPGGLSLSSAGVVSGTPTNGSTFSLIVQVTDKVGASATEMFTVEIQDNAPTIGVESYTSGTITLLISGAAGPDYTIEASTNLVDWETVFTTNAPALPFRWSDTAATNPVTFYRALLNP